MTIENINKNNNTRNDYGKVVVLMGGWSAEREVSLNGGSAVVDALQKQDIDCVALDIKKSEVFSQISNCEYDIAFNMLHGRGGEDGIIQALLELKSKPYTGSDVSASAITMDKVKTKQLLEGVGLPTPSFAVITEESDLEYIASSLGLPLVVKPALEGSSFGMSIVEEVSEFYDAYVLASDFCSSVMAEAFIEGIEYTATILGDDVLPIIRLETPRKFYDYVAKYEATDTHYFCPAGLDNNEEEQLKNLALSAFKACGAIGWGRVDLFIDQDNKPWIIEINTVPGMTDHSLVPMSAAQAGINFETLVLMILDEALKKEKYAEVVNENQSN
ncbi:D-alanine--D-alanine ligase [hydrothermal vent metagenome]|uniref:D-alanine--D-alanine ligase n=1 Tax=hydrothermal vent metagenome TaxID=652676 RepID=A0A3B1AH00_9ZZZZ